MNFVVFLREVPPRDTQLSGFFRQMSLPGVSLDLLSVGFHVPVDFPKIFTISGPMPILFFDQIQQLF